MDDKILKRKWKNSHYSQKRGISIITSVILEVLVNAVKLTTK